ncbi:AP-3 complex subunit beta-2-like isoform X3 [Penaeus chinensis]|uniref:AP-3 complex subunit beta-2-like isoform X3 n=1 Tax=Penaeus chinensis TaxID=139456 RepID=UPI001FB7C2D1|nr:AP-3 complex subunit beta-2-like isoform X3 [Penaeus chinensis]
MSTGGSYNSERPPSVDVDYSADPASGSFFSTEFKKHEDLKQMLDSNKDGLKLEAMKRIIGMVAKGRDASDLFPAVVKNVVSANLEVKKLVYVYLVRYAEEQQDLALLSISTFQRALKDPNQLIRACALRVLSSIRVPVIVPIMMLAIKDAVSDMSPYVRKTAAHAIPKLYNLDPEQKEELIQVIEKLLSDKTTLVVGSAVMAFEEVCPERIDLIHKNYRKLCNLLVDVEEWGQVIIINMLTRYARTQFIDPNAGEGLEEKEKPFYEDDEQEEPEDADTLVKRPKTMDPDHRLLLRNTKPLLQSRNAAVVLAVAQLYQHIAPRSEVSQVARALVRLLRSHREVQAVVLTNIASMSTRRKANASIQEKGMFEPYLKSFFVRSSDPTHIKALKLEVLTNLATDANISVILREFQTYIGSSDKEFVAATIQAIGRCASNIREVTDTCLSGLVSLLSNRDESVVGESVVVIRKLLQSETVGHKDIISHMARLVDNIKIPMARASILWLLGEYCDKVPKIAPDVLRKMAKTFITEEDIVKLQILTLATKLYLTNPKQTRLLCQYVYNLAKYDTNYDIRDRARLTRALVFPSQGHEDNKLAKHAKKIFLATKPPPVQQSSFKDRDQFQLSTLSHFINARASGYQDLPPFPDDAPDPSVRNVEMPTPVTPVFKSAHQKKKPQKVKSFYSDESSPEDESDEEESESGSESDSESDSSESDSSESSSEEESESESDDDEDEKQRTRGKAKRKSGSGGRKREASESSGSEESESESSESESESSSSESESSSDEESENSESSDEDTKKKKSKEKASNKSKATQGGGNRTNLDLLLDLDDIPPTMDTPLLTPSLGGLLTPTPTAQPAQPLPPGASIQPASAKFVPTTTHELLNRFSGSGLSVGARFTRSPHLYSPRMTSVELTFTNTGTEEIRDISIGRKKLAPGMSLHEFAGIAVLNADTTLHGTLGVDFNDTTQPAVFDLIAGGRTFSISVTAPIGELMTPLAMSEADFNLNQGKLRGMNELSGTAKLPSEQNIKALVDHVYETANLLQVQSLSDNVLKFGGQTASGKVLVLLSLTVPEETAECSITINCEKMVVSSMLLKELQSALAKD